MQMDLSMQAPILLLWLFPPVVLAASGGCSSFRNDTTVEQVRTLRALWKCAAAADEQPPQAIAFLAAVAALHTGTGGDSFGASGWFAVVDLLPALFTEPGERGGTRRNLFAACVAELDRLTGAAAGKQRWQRIAQRWRGCTSTPSLATAASPAWPPTLQPWASGIPNSFTPPAWSARRPPTPPRA